MEFLGREATSRVFFCFFFVLRQPEHDPTQREPRQGAITFRVNSSRCLFKAVTDSNHDYKERFFFVRAVNPEAKAMIGDYQDGLLLRLYHPRSWCRKHFVRNGVVLRGIDYATELKFLSPDERESFNILNEWAARMLKVGKKIDCQFLVENFEEDPGVVNSYLRKLMDDPNNIVHLDGDWESAGVGIEIPKVDPAVARSLKKRRKNPAFKPSSSGAQGPPRPTREEIAAGQKASGPDVATQSAEAVHAVALPVPQAVNPPQQDAPNNAAAGPGDEEQRLRDEMDARLREQGWAPFVEDLEAMKRVYSVGMNLFRRMSEDVPAEMARVLRGKIAAHKSENSKYAGELEKVQAELNSQRDKRYLDLSSENRGLREQAEKAQKLKEELDGARSKIAEQAKQLEALPGIKADTKKAKMAEKEAREEVEALKKQVEELSAGKAEVQKKIAAAHAGGYQKALNLSFALAPWLHDHSAFFDGKHYGKDGKVWLGNQVVYEPPPESDGEEEKAADGEAGH